MNYEPLAAILKENQAKVWLLLASTMGGLTSLGFLKPLTWGQRLLSIMVSASAALFLAPALVEWLLPHAPANSKIVAAVYYLITASVMSAFPPFLGFVGKVASNPVDFVKSYFGPKT